jgi:hypothetical protein
MTVGMPAKWSIASVPAGPRGPAEDAQWSRGMAMSMKEKLLFLWVLVMVAVGFMFRHFWACTIYAIGRAVALNVVSLPGLAKFTAGIFGMFFVH